MDYVLNFDCEDLKVKLSNMSVSCYGATGLFDFDYHFDIKIEDVKANTLIKQKFEDDISELISFCKGGDSLKSVQNDCILKIFLDDSKNSSNVEPCMILNFETKNLRFNKKIGYCKESVEDFKLELKSIYESLIEQYIKEHPDKNCTITKVKF